MWQLMEWRVLLGWVCNTVMCESWTSFSCVHYNLNTVSPHKTVAEFIDLWLGDKVNSGIGLSYWPASPCSLAGGYDNPMPELTLSPQSGSMSSATEITLRKEYKDDISFKPFDFVCSVWPAAAGESVWRGGSGRPPAEPPVPTGGGGYPHSRAALRAAQLPSRPLRPSWPWLQLPDHQWTVRQYWLVNNIDFVSL